MILEEKDLNNIGDQISQVWIQVRWSQLHGQVLNQVVSELCYQPETELVTQVKDRVAGSVWQKIRNKINKL